MRDSLHAVLYEELESVPVLVHVEVSSMYLGDDVLDIKDFAELSAFLKLKDYLLEVVVARKNCHNNDTLLFPLSLLLCQSLLPESESLTDEFWGLKFEVLRDMPWRFELNSCKALRGEELSQRFRELGLA